MQYLAWPDHGVPSDPNLFLEFTEKVRAARKTTLLQEIDQSLKQMRLFDNKIKNNDGEDVDDVLPATILSIENGTADDVATTSQHDARTEGSATDIGECETVLVSSEGESPEEIVLPPSTSIHQYISAANPPVIVHCSAGIGRTGVLILMDTALSLMATKEPVYPLDIVLAMRDQRACMVQNVVSI